MTENSPRKMSPSKRRRYELRQAKRERLAKMTSRERFASFANHKPNPIYDPEVKKLCEHYAFTREVSDEPRAAVGYVRVSTEQQAKHGVSLEAQEKRIVAYCEAHGLSLLQIYKDAGISGEKVKTRPGIMSAVERCKENGAVLVAYSLSRISRKIKHLMEISEQLVRHGGDIACIVETIDTSTATGRMMFKLLALFAEFERDLLIERINTGMEVARNKFQKLSRYSPYGWKEETVNDRLVPDEAEQEIRSKILNYLNSGLNAKEVRDKLNDSGLRRRGGKKWETKNIISIANHAVKLGEMAHHVPRKRGPL